MNGHSVLQLPVAALEEWVVTRTRHYDPGFVSADPRFGHAHITALGPFVPEPTAGDLEAVGVIASSTRPITVRLEEVAQFPDGIIHLVPSPAAPLVELTRRLVERFPGFPPYAGVFGPLVRPHLTLDAACDDVSVASTAQALAGLLPVVQHLDVLQLAWWESGRCHVMAEWSLGADVAQDPERSARALR